MFSPILLLLGFVSISQQKSHSAVYSSEPIPHKEPVFLVALQESVLNIFFCGGVLFHPYYVLTVARCVYNYRKKADRIRVFTNTSYKNDKRYSRKVKHIIIHEQFTPNNGKRIHDIALLRLFLPILESAHIKFAYLPSRNERIKERRPVRVFNLGRKTGNTVQIMQSKLNIVNKKYCKSKYRSIGLHVSKAHVCAHNANSRISCIGGLGFPLVDRRRRIIGLVTFPFSCFQLLKTGFPTVYSHVASDVEWIFKKLRTKSRSSVIHNSTIY